MENLYEDNLALAVSLRFASSAFAATSLPQIQRDDAATIPWNEIVGAITALNVDNPVADIDSVPLNVHGSATFLGSIAASARRPRT